MKSWYDLEKQEQKFLKKEFNKKIKKPYILKFILTACIIIFALLVIISLYSDSQMICYQNACKVNAEKFGILLSISIGVFVLIDLYQSQKNNKAFSSWLETRKIKK